MYRALLIASLSFGLVLPATASGGGGKKKGASNHYEAKWDLNEKSEIDVKIDTKRSEQAVDLPMLTLPTSIGPSLVSYIFVAIRINLNDDQDAWPVRAKSHFINDAIIRFSHKQSSTLITEDGELDQEKLTDLVLASVEPWVSSDAVESVEYTKFALQQ
ncbi:MAG: hypothetical protein COA47_11095 [Robiginitomaculum sp.]|nr:MAG: hypothetical protein COA47_11095 [Robiginitomaculum sp.]